MAFPVEATLPPENPVSALHVWPRESVYADPPQLTRIGVKVPVGRFNVTLAVPFVTPSALLRAVTVTGWAAVIVAGAVYWPVLDIDPRLGAMDQVTAVLLEPVTLAVNCCCCDWPRLAVGGETETLIPLAGTI